MDKKIICVLIFAAGLAVGVGGLFLLQFQTANILTSEEAGKIAMNFINTALEQDNVTASLTGIVEESGVYKLHLAIAEKEYDSFISKDGKYLFSTAFDLKRDEMEKAAPEAGVEGLAKCLADKGAKFYGASWCSHCKNQKEMFGEAEKYLPYVECSTEDGKGQLDVCKEKNISSYPTWEFPDGSRETGELSFEKLSEKTGCQLPQ